MLWKKNHTPDGSSFFCSAVVVAAGNSSRMGTNKLLLELNGLPILAHTLLNLQNCDCIHEIIIVCRSEDIVVYSDLAATYEISKLAKVVKGGSERAASVAAGLAHINRNATLAAIHDAARPLADPVLIERVVRLAASTNAAIPVVPVKDTLKQIHNGIISQTPDRFSFFAAQTPQVFDVDLLKGALQNAVNNGLQITDDASAVEALGVSVYSVTGSYQNIKITTPEDLAVAEVMLNKLQ